MELLIRIATAAITSNVATKFRKGFMIVFCSGTIAGQPQNLPKGTEENHVRPRLKIVDIRKYHLWKSNVFVCALGQSVLTFKVEN